MPTFNLWNPHTYEPHGIELDVTPTYPESVVGRGAPEWISACLHALHVEAVPYQWAILPMRTHFYSDYPEEDEWRDRWPRGWLLRIELTRDAPSMERYPHGYPVELHVIDPSAEPGSVDPRHDRASLVSAEFSVPIERAREIKDELIGIARTSFGPSLRIETATLALPEGRWQLRALLQGIELPTDVPHLDRMRDLLKARGGAITWKHVAGLESGPALPSRPLEVSIDSSLSEAEIRSLLLSQQPGLFRPVSGADKLAEGYDEWTASGQSERLRDTLSHLLTDEDAKIRTAVIRFFQLRPDASDGGALERAFQSHSRLFLDAEPDPPEMITGNLQFQLARALAERSSEGDPTALNCLRVEALQSGHGEAAVFALFTADRDWLFQHAAEIVIRNPSATARVFSYLTQEGLDLRPLLLAARSSVPRAVLESALQAVDPPNIAELSNLLKG